MTKFRRKWGKYEEMMRKEMKNAIDRFCTNSIKYCGWYYVDERQRLMIIFNGAFYWAACYTYMYSMFECEKNDTQKSTKIFIYEHRSHTRSYEWVISIEYNKLDVCVYQSICASFFSFRNKIDGEYCWLAERRIFVNIQRTQRDRNRFGSLFV